MTTTNDVAVPGISPGPLIKMTIADCSARVLQSAVQLGVFTFLADGAADSGAIAAGVGVHERLAEDFLDALAGLGLLHRDGDRYRNGPLADAYLVRDRDGYLGGFVELTDQTFYQTWSRLTDALRTGDPQRLDPDKGGFVGEEHSDPERMKRFLSGLDAYSDRMGAELAGRIDWSGYSSFVDLGGARGNLAAVLVRAHPHLDATCFDLPRTSELFDEHIGRLGLTGRIGFAGGDFLTDPLPVADVVVLGHILHGFDDGQRVALLTRVFDAVRPGGRVLIYDRMIDDDRSDPERLMSSLHMKLVSAHGSEYRVGDCRSWLRAAGFTSTTEEPMLDTHTLVIGAR
ncbi:8-O-methyltransferase [Lentzea albidocapillata subsp. violacea]|uniref:8-O-methyltransferase n=1 Tax=Lentzea albidocapillata subsp. violacea TaxID=128104 RepID=A0A1G9LTF1_9PSEU|nr:methyltransferase [Lentzea albidocapillata]SDL65372.1 8-O-methyltransferase [Lentzea albidocapillata subsp. violacea]